MVIPRAKPLTLTFVRVALGLIALMHGLANTFGLFGGPGLEEFATQMEAKVSIAPGLTTYVVAIGELLAGISLVLGPFARISAAVLMLFVVLGCFVTARYTTFFIGNNGFEYLLALFALTLVVCVHGPGQLILKLPKRKKKDKKGQDKE